MAVFAAIYLVVLGYIFAEQRSFLYFPDTRKITPAEAGLAEYRGVTIDGTTSWWRPPTRKDAPVIIHFHGNGGSIGTRGELYAALARDNFGMLAVEYPGYGGNRGKPSEAALFAGAQSAYDWLIHHGYQPKQIVIAGQSLGTGVAIRLASENSAAGLLLEAPYRSMTEMAERSMPFVPVKLLLLDRYDSASRIGDLRMPIAWVHGRRDTLIPFTIGQSLFDSAKSQKCNHVIARAGHNDLWEYDIAAFFRANAEEMVRAGQCTALPAPNTSAS